MGFSTEKSLEPNTSVLGKPVYGSIASFARRFCLDDRHDTIRAVKSLESVASLIE